GILERGGAAALPHSAPHTPPRRPHRPRRTSPGDTSEHHPRLSEHNPESFEHNERAGRSRAMSRSPRRPSSSRVPRHRPRTACYITIVAALAIVAFVVLVIDHGLTGALRVLVGQDPEGGQGTPGPGTSADAEQAQRLLAEIPVEEPRPRGDYERDEFGSSWVDTDDNGCSTRHDILARDLDRVQVADGCKVTEGVLDDPYTGERLEFTSEDPQAVQIDHVVPLSLA